ncbi:type II CRISPR-associated endonuclease Cas1 [Arcanobacterium bovis]|uniref:CRISPR-associated endonuclease Cas1 n=1 Tax=Arcanobacterium bovis TaxID=2529275 RepID=A0A4V2KQZ2_9ACTO|nr:type II CRISPR-associated endonuclease Cas1 [Arcanobacterium bovis]TBW20917.1 type II CRISPR-associated endonuclease Cas1 [Arcanobacterium bovis]
MARLNAEQWRILDFSSFQGKVSPDRGSLLITPDGGDAVRVPTADVGIVFIGVNTRFSAGALHRLFGDDVSVIFCDWKGVPIGGAYAWSEHSRVGARQIAQMESSLPRRKSAWASVVKAKILGQANVLDFCRRPNAGLLRRLAKELKSGDSSNNEGQAARIYWSSLWGDEGFRRQPGVRDDVFTSNALLDYGYTVLRGHAMRAVLSAGLTPALGMFHRGRSNNFNLADDLIEPFRPAIDACVASTLCNESIDSKEARKELVQVAGDSFGESGNSIPAELVNLAQHYGQYLEGDINKLSINVWKPTLTLGIYDGE